MITTNSPHNFTLTVNHTYPAAREKVFNAWVNPEELKKWWGPEGYHTTIEEMEVEVNGKYKYLMHPPNGEARILTGTYLEIIPFEKLVFTWKWDNDDFPTTKVTIDFLEKDQLTEVNVTHSNLPSEEAAKGHNDGWTSSLQGSLQKLLCH
jgi:uncharacterized protein YndB with AHSA1/START domain